MRRALKADSRFRKTRSTQKRVEREQERQKSACHLQTVIRSFKVGDPVCTRNYKLRSMWGPGNVTEMMGSRRYSAWLLNEDQLWHWERDNTQCAEITGATGTTPIIGDSPPVFPHHQ